MEIEKRRTFKKREKLQEVKLKEKVKRKFKNKDLKKLNEKL